MYGDIFYKFFDEKECEKFDDYMGLFMFVVKVYFIDKGFDYVVNV